MPSTACTATNERELVIFTIYDHPRDYPDSFVIRRWVAVDGKELPGEAKLAPTLEAARELLPDGVYCLGRSPGDDLCIVETWI